MEKNGSVCRFIFKNGHRIVAESDLAKKTIRMRSCAVPWNT